MAHAVVMFSVLTVGWTVNRATLSDSYIDGREFAGVEGFPRGPMGYLTLLLWDKQAISYVDYLVFPFNQWLADGFLVSSASNSAALAGVT